MACDDLQITTHAVRQLTIASCNKALAYSNGIENVWSLLKLVITGPYHNIRVKHLNAYLDELEWPSIMGRTLGYPVT